MTQAQALRLLGLKIGDDAAAIRRAYAARLKAMDVDADPAGYAALRDARDGALRAAKARAKAAPEPDLDESLVERSQRFDPPVGVWRAIAARPLPS